MNENEKVIKEIIEACSKNTHLFDIIKDITKLDNDERYKLRRKASQILSKNNGIDKEALKFYYVVTEQGVAEEILRRIQSSEIKT
ncbi:MULTISPECIES: hypothetical protein [Petrotoga]|uniref:Uncharacterized protein n=2 Tax=Petrotoga sibirica TaxID=156202 RepID=A0A4R8EUB1_9BACT|nr:MULTISPECIES: hypothetical protein [Petrotoga]KUK82850.1 MAG: Uncharacterized protein XD96_0636 [Petrotoga mobilis]POZ89495.1 hypothetical protein AA80_00060 [Petrotoga sibirica DSM 13575]POZ91837.1 hypothetical protein AD60_00060 [Petrotoga sp. SL27]TDX16184.1 hypothetical protein C8D74_1042 [Petrotoga sibirica]